MKFYFNKKFLILFTTIAILGFTSRLVFAAWSGTFYEPGDTLNPECLPTDTDCDVRAPLTSTSISDTTYGASWDSDTTHAPSKNAIYDKIETVIGSAHDAVTLGTANGLSLAAQVLSMDLASGTTTGSLSSADWTTFNNKADALGADDNYATDAEKIKLSNLSGTNTGDQTSIVGITGTLSQFNTAVTDADLARTDAANTFTGTQTFNNNVTFVGGGSHTGTISTTNGNCTITGVGTSFLTDLRAGDTITPNGQSALPVSWVRSDTSLETSPCSSVTASGLTYTTSANTFTIYPNGTFSRPLSSRGSTATSECLGNTAGCTGTGAEYVAIGHLVTMSSTGSKNVVIGSSASISGSSTESVVIGAQANTQGSNNIVIGLANSAGSSAGNNILLGTGVTNNSSSSILLGRDYVCGTSCANTALIGAGSLSITDAYFGKGKTNSSPSAITINATGGSGTDIAGASLTLAGGKGTGNAAGGSLIFSTSDAGASGTTLQSLTEKMRINYDGKVGIGDTTPDYLLDVAGTAGFDGAVTVTGSADAVQLQVIGNATQTSQLFNFKNSTNSAKMYMDQYGRVTIDSDAGNGDFPLTIKYNGTTVASVGHTGILTGNIFYSSQRSDTVSPSATNMNLKGPGGYWALRTGTAYDINFDVYNGGSSLAALTILQAGNIGIGDTTPDYKLDVAGTAGFDGLVTFATSPTSPGSGSNTERWGSGASTGTATDSVAIGTNAIKNGAGAGSVIIGSGATVNSAAGIAIGYGANTVNQGASPRGSIAIGYQASASGWNTSEAGGAGGIAIGELAVTSGTAYGIAIGTKATTAHSSIVIGHGNTSTTASGQLLLGGATAGITDTYIGKGVTNGTPEAITIQTTGASGTNIAGASLTLAGGKGTGNAAGGSLIFSTSDAGASGTTLQSLTPKMTINAAGNVLVGTSTSAHAVYKLQVGDGSTDSRALFWNNSQYALGVRGGSSPTYGGYFLGASGAVAPDLIFSNNAGTEKARLTDGGSLGIGDTTPDYLLDVAGTAGFDGLVTFATSPTSPGGTSSERWGAGAVATANYSVAVGAGASAPSGSGGYFTAIGYNASASGPNGAVAIGNTSSSSSGSSIAIGSNSSASGANYATAIGGGANASVLGGIAIGGVATASTGNYAIAIGNSATASNTTTIAMGYGATASGSSSLAIGSYSSATASAGVAIGQSTSANYQGAVALGFNSVATAANQFVVGGNYATPGYAITNTYIGDGVTSTGPVSTAINASGGSGTNIAGASLTLAGGKATGNAAGGSLIFSTSDAGASGTTLQSLTEKMRLTATGYLGIGTSSPGAALNLASGKHLLIGGTTAPYSDLYNLAITASDAGAAFVIDAPTSDITGRAFSVAATGEAYGRVLFYSNGQIGFGSGAATRDTFLGRSAANTIGIGSAYDGSGTGHLNVTGNITVGGSLLPDANDGAVLGSSTSSFSDLFLASGGVINWNNGDVTLTHSADTLTLAGGALDIQGAVTMGSGTEAMRITTDGNLKIGGTATRATTEGTKTLDIFDGTAPVGTLANGISLYSTAGELRVMDAAGNATLLSPHENEHNYWVFDSANAETGKTLVIDMELAMKDLNSAFNWDYVHEVGGDYVKSEESSLLQGLFAKISTWLSDTTNGIAKIFTNEIETKTLCVADETGEKTCITKDQLDALLINAGISSSHSSGGSSSGGSSEPAPEPESTIEEPEPTNPPSEETTGGTGEPTPEATPEPAPEPSIEETPAPAEEPTPEPTPELESTPGAADADGGSTTAEPAA